MSEPTGTNQSGGRGGRRAPALSVAAASLLVAAWAVAWACRASDGGAAGGAHPTAAGSAGGVAPAGVPQASPTPAAAAGVLTTLTPAGFTPAEVGAVAGQFSLRVRNESGRRQVRLRLKKADGEVVTEAQLTDKVREWRVPLELSAGSYVLTEGAHPEWTCRVEVTTQ